MNITHPDLYQINHGFLDPEFKAAVTNGQWILADNDGEMENDDNEFINLEIVDSIVTTHADNIFSFKAFTEEFAQKMLEETLNCGVDWERNPDEDEYRSMPEIRLREMDQRLFDMFKHFVLEWFAYVTEDYWKVHSNMLADAQFARYDPTHQKHGNWHHDASSDITFVMPLSADFEGGGTEFLNQNIQINPLPLGHVLCFPGRVTHLHRGKLVTKGERYILTAWTKIIDGAY